MITAIDICSYSYLVGNCLLSCPYLRHLLDCLKFKHLTGITELFSLEYGAYTCYFQVHINLTNLTENELGPLEVALSQDDSPEDRVVMINGLQKMVMTNEIMTGRCLKRLIFSLHRPVDI